MNIYKHSKRGQVSIHIVKSDIKSMYLKEVSPKLHLIVQK